MTALIVGLLKQWCIDAIRIGRASWYIGILESRSFNEWFWTWLKLRSTSYDTRTIPRIWTLSSWNAAIIWYQFARSFCTKQRKLKIRKTTDREIRWEDEREKNQVRGYEVGFEQSREQQHGSNYYTRFLFLCRTWFSHVLQLVYLEDMTTTARPVQSLPGNTKEYPLL